MYCIPCNASHVLSINTLTDEVKLVSPNLGNVIEKWEGGTVGNDGCMYCLPQQAKHVLCIAGQQVE